MLRILFLSMVLSSCGLIERFKTPEQPTDSKDVTSTESSTAPTESPDDLFANMDESNAATTAGTDAPTNVTSNDPDLKSLEDEFSSSGPNETQIKETVIAQEPAKTPTPTEAPVIVEEALPEIKTEVATSNYDEAGTIKTYRVQKGETLMQVAFKLYGDISKWKEIKSLNNDKLTNNSSLKTNAELKYRAPAAPFVWNPTGTPYLIKNGETLGTISNTVYSTPKKWKAIWENNKPLIQNPNVIYAGFTLYYTNGMANYVQPKSAQPKKQAVTAAPAYEEDVIAKNEIEDESNLQEVDEAVQTLSATKRAEVTKALEKAVTGPKEAEIDLINNISVPANENEIDIDEEVQTL